MQHPWQHLKQKAWELARRAGDRHLRLAVTGLAGSGKTAFISAIVDQLTRESVHASHLPLFNVCREKRLRHVRRLLQPDLEVASFAYDSAAATLRNTPPAWPSSTTTISELRLALSFRTDAGFLAGLTTQHTLYLDIVDYPGEWLLDLPMLQQDYRQWCEAMFAAASNLSSAPLYQQFLELLQQIDCRVVVSDEQLAMLAESYQQLLTQLVQQGFYLAQPGRMLLPGELAGTPILAFFPLPPSQLPNKEEKLAVDSMYRVLARRFDAYKAKVVQPFYREYFVGFDRQLVLVDCFTALNRGKAQFEDMCRALLAINQSFQFGQNSLLRRLFAPKIERLLFAASKVDQVTRDQQGNVLALLNAMLAEGRQQASSTGCQVETMAVSALQATRPGMVADPERGMVEVVSGFALTDNQPLTIYPGEVPRSLPDAQFWARQGFHFRDFAPPPEPVDGFAHIRLDHLLQFLLGDKLQ